MSQMYKTTTLLSIAALFYCAQGDAFAANEAIGVNSAVKGNVTIQSLEQAAKQAVIKEPVLLGDVVKSNKVGSLQVLLKDQTTFTVGPNCDLTIDKFVYDPTKNANSMSATVKKGMFRFMSGNISKSGPDSVSIDTPIASMGIRGTMVEGLIGPEALAMAQNSGVVAQNAVVDTQNASLFILRGPGRGNVSKNKRGKISVTSGGQTVIVKKSGLAVFVADKNSPPSQPFELSQADNKVFHNKLRTEPSGGQSYKPFIVEAGFPVKNNDIDRQNDIEFFDPMTDLQWPTQPDITDQPDFPSHCTLLNPHYPNCP